MVTTMTQRAKSTRTQTSSLHDTSPFEQRVTKASFNDSFAIRDPIKTISRHPNPPSSRIIHVSPDTKSSIVVNIHRGPIIARYLFGAAWKFIKKQGGGFEIGRKGRNIHKDIFVCKSGGGREPRAAEIKFASAFREIDFVPATLCYVSRNNSTGGNAIFIGDDV